MSEHPVYQNFIGGQWVDARSGATYERHNPADTREIVGIIQDSGAEDIEAAVAAGQEAFKGWRKLGIQARAELIFKAAELLERQRKDDAVLMTREMGKVLRESHGDIQEAITTARTFAGEGRRPSGHIGPSAMASRMHLAVREPLGVVGLITPWNFPMTMPAWKLFPALVLGNTVVLKPAEETPMSAIRMVQALEAAGVPAGVVNLVTGNGPNAGEPLVRHPGVPALSFTGSTDTGRIIGRLAGEQLKRVSLELGGKNPMIVLADADLDAAVKGALWGSFLTTGQRCNATSRLIVERPIAEQLLAQLVQKTNALRIGSGLDERAQIGPIVSEAQLKRVERYVELGKQEGATLVTGGSRYSDDERRHGYFFQPTIFMDVTTSMRIFQEEIFGPVLGVTVVDSLDEAIAVANDVQYGLSAAIYTKDGGRAMYAARELQAGMIALNAPSTSSESNMPFGGMKASGNGHREGSEDVLNTFSEWKTITLDAVV